MKKISVFISLVIVAMVISYCSPEKKAAREAKRHPKLKYEINIKALVAANCTPCHIPSKGGNKKPFDTYAAAQANIDDMIRRISLTPADRGFMPFKGKKLSDSIINQFRQWKTDGLLEK
jgi:hypothetical protein